MFKMTNKKSLFQEVELLEQVRMEQEGGHYFPKGCILRERNVTCEAHCVLQKAKHIL